MADDDRLLELAVTSAEHRGTVSLDRPVRPAVGAGGRPGVLPATWPRSRPPAGWSAGPPCTARSRSGWPGSGWPVRRRSRSRGRSVGCGPTPTLHLTRVPGDRDRARLALQVRVRGLLAPLTLLWPLVRSRVVDAVRAELSTLLDPIMDGLDDVAGCASDPDRLADHALAELADDLAEHVPALTRPRGDPPETSDPTPRQATPRLSSACRRPPVRARSDRRSRGGPVTGRGGRATPGPRRRPRGPGS